MEDIFPKRWAGATEGKGQRGVFQRPGLWEIDTCCWGRISVWFLVEMTWAVGRWDRELFPVLRYPGLSITVYWVHDSDSIYHLVSLDHTGPHEFHLWVSVPENQTGLSFQEKSCLYLCKEWVYLKAYLWGYGWVWILSRRRGWTVLDRLFLQLSIHSLFW